jgi:hypothetical protein
MSMSGKGGLGLGAFLVVFLALADGLARAGDCDEHRTTIGNVNVYEDVPQFSTGRGWQLAPQIATLAPNEVVRVCKKKNVGFPASQTWLWIRFESDGEERQGWVREKLLQDAGALDSGDTGARSVLPVAMLTSAAASSDDDAASLGPPSTAPLAALLFVFMLLGMIAKGLFDQLNGEGFQRKPFLRGMGISLLVSPMIFLALSKVADFSIGATSGSTGFIVYLFTGFQNGFCWQTLFQGLMSTHPKSAHVEPARAAAIGLQPRRA